MSDFSLLNRNRLYESLEVNDDLQLDEIEVNGKTSWFRIRNVFKDPDAAVESLKNWPVLTGHVYTPGGRQNFTPMDLVPLVKAYSKIAEAITNKEHKPESFISSSNVVPPNPRVWDGSWHPHTDHDLVFNLWLCDWTEGTGLFTYKNCLSSREYKGIPDQKLNRDKIVDWQNPKTEDGYEHYYTIPCEYNTLTIYDGKLFHGTIMGKGTGYRYSLISFHHPKESF
jgi:hypothetical protein